MQEKDIELPNDDCKDGPVKDVSHLIAVAEFMEEHLCVSGMEGWKVIVTELHGDSSIYADAFPNIYEKELEVRLYDDFWEQTPKRKANILLHELIHAKFSIYNHMIREHVATMEEHFVNDLVRGLESVCDFEFNGK